MGNHPETREPNLAKTNAGSRLELFAFPKSLRRFFPGARVRVFCHVRVEISHRESRT